MSSDLYGDMDDKSEKAEEAAKRETHVTIKLRELTWNIFQECCFHVDADEKKISNALEKAFLQASMDIMSDVYGTDQTDFVRGYEYIRDVAWSKVIRQEP